MFDDLAHIEYGVIESLLILILQPQEHDSMYICTVVLELCKLAPTLIPPVLASGDLFTVVEFNRQLK